MDRSTSITIASPADGAHAESAPAFSFSTEDGASATCTTLEGGSGDTSPGQSPCSASYTPAASAPGEYRVRIASTDAVGNTAMVTRGFVIDAPPQTPADPGQQPNPGGSGQGGTGQGGTGQGGTGGGGPGPGPIGNTISSAAILHGLGKDLATAARKLSRQKQRRLRKARRQTLRVHALSAGTFVVKFSGKATKAKAARSVAIAKGRTVAVGAGAYKLKLKLTKAGTRLLRRGKRVTGRLTMSFTSTNGRLTKSRKVTLKRR